VHNLNLFEIFWIVEKITRLTIICTVDFKLSLSQVQVRCGLGPVVPPWFNH